MTNMPFMRPVLFGFVCAFTTSLAGVARAQEATPAAPAAAEPSCAESYEQAQRDQRDGKYLSAAAAALSCAQLRCNQAIVRECTRLYDQLEASTPTLAVSALTHDGRALIDVKVEMDGQPLLERITGKLVPVDPGPHAFVFTHAEFGRVEVSRFAQPGEKGGRVEATFPDPNPKPAEPVPNPLATNAPPAVEQKRGGIPVLTYVLGGVGLVGMGGFAFFRISAVGDYNDYNSTCSPQCNPDDIDSVRTKFTLSYVSLGIGAAGLAGAGVVFALSRGGSESSQTEARLVPTAGGAAATLRTTF